MAKRIWTIFAAALLLATSVTPAALAKEKHKTPAEVIRVNPDAQQGEPLDPTDPDDLTEILVEADAAHYPTNGAKADFALAFDLYTRAAQVEDPTALNQLGLMYDFGDYVSIDDAQAVAYYLRAANAGSIAGKNNLALMYQAGEGTPKDLAEAVYWFRQAANDGYGYSMYQLGNMFYAGNGVAKDIEEAVAWYQKASDAGEPNAHWELALSYLYGETVGKDSQHAGELAYFALTHGVDVALEQLQRIGTAYTSPNFRRRIQELLKQDGYYTGSIDGSFGPKTMAAVKASFGTAQ